MPYSFTIVLTAYCARFIPYQKSSTCLRDLLRIRQPGQAHIQRPTSPALPPHRDKTQLLGSLYPTSILTGISYHQKSGQLAKKEKPQGA